VTTLDHIGRLERFQDVPDDGPMCDLLWSDPEAKVGDWARSDQGDPVLWGLRPATKSLNPNIKSRVAPETSMRSRNDDNKNPPSKHKYTVNQTRMPLFLIFC
jgi:hypothetical protein